MANIWKLKPSDIPWGNNHQDIDIVSKQAIVCHHVVGWDTRENISKNFQRCLSFCSEATEMPWQVLLENIHPTYSLATIWNRWDHSVGLYIYIYIYIYTEGVMVTTEGNRHRVQSLGEVLFTNPSARARYDTRSIFKRSLTGLNSEFSFS